MTRRGAFPTTSPQNKQSQPSPPSPDPLDFGGDARSVTVRPAQGLLFRRHRPSLGTGTHRKEGSWSSLLGDLQDRDVMIASSLEKNAPERRLGRVCSIEEERPTSERQRRRQFSPPASSSRSSIRSFAANYSPRVTLRWALIQRHLARLTSGVRRRTSASSPRVWPRRSGPRA